MNYSLILFIALAIFWKMAERIAEYKRRLHLKARKSLHLIPATEFTNEVTLECWHLDSSDLPQGFTVSTTKKEQEAGKLVKFQYDMRDIKKRPIAWRVPFLLDPNFDNDKFTISHLCHNPQCYNYHHHAFEPLAVNKGRNGCAGGKGCAHKKYKCLMQGPDVE